MEEIKICAKCDNNKKITEFGKNKSRLDGLCCICLQCRKDENTEKQEKKIQQRIQEHYIEGEIWKTVPNFDKYMASNLGRIKNIETNSLITPNVTAAGYHCCNLYNNDSKPIGVKIHRIIGQTFIPNIDGKPTINHKNKNTKDNSVANLEWSTLKEQATHKWAVDPPIKKDKIIEPTILPNVTDEVWKIITNYENYQISNYGRVKYTNRVNGNIVITTGSLTAYGYKKFQVKNKNGKKSYPVHRLVAEMFIPNEDNKLLVNHIDGNKSNNKVSNLLWSTHSENTQHAYDTNLHGGKKEIYQLNDKNEIIKKWDSIKDATEFLKLGPTRINSCLLKNGKTSRTAGGYFWQYVDSYDENIKTITQREYKKIKIKQLDKKTKKVIKLWDSIMDAAQYLCEINNKPDMIKIMSSNIYQCVIKTRKTCYGFAWKAQ